MVTDDGNNLLDPGNTPHENMVFLIMLCAVVRAVDKYAKLLRASVANVGNEHRLGANEAPPAIVSIFLGDQLTDIFDQLASGGAKSSTRGGELKLGVSTLPPLPKDSTDRNRTSPFAFTGNKFEFRMVGSTQSTSGPNFVLNTIVAEILEEIADELEKAGDVKSAAQKITRRIAKEHRRIVYNGDNYTEEWVVEAEKRGLPNIRSTVDSLKTIMDKENVDVLKKHKVLSKMELQARAEILFENYSKMLHIEACTMLNIAKRQILPAASQYSGILAGTVQSILAAGVPAEPQNEMLVKVCDLIKSLYQSLESLEKVLEKTEEISNTTRHAESYRDHVIPAMVKVREAADELEMVVDADLWPLPSYAEMLFIK
jgi:glutamine synthetase